MSQDCDKPQAHDVVLTPAPIMSRVLIPFAPALAAIKSAAHADIVSSDADGSDRFHFDGRGDVDNIGCRKAFAALRRTPRKSLFTQARRYAEGGDQHPSTC